MYPDPFLHYKLVEENSPDLRPEGVQKNGNEDDERKEETQPRTAELNPRRLRDFALSNGQVGNDGPHQVPDDPDPENRQGEKADEHTVEYGVKVHMFPRKRRFQPLIAI